MGFASQAFTSIKNNHKLLGGKTTLKKRLDQWYGKAYSKPSYDELKEWKKSERARKKQLALAIVALMGIFTLFSVFIIIMFQ